MRGDMFEAIIAPPVRAGGVEEHAHGVAGEVGDREVGAPVAVEFAAATANGPSPAA